MAMQASNKRLKAITGAETASEILPAVGLIFSTVDLLTEILLRLPVKSLIRFKSVSKHWLSLITHPQFSGNHPGRNPILSISGLYFYECNKLRSVSLHGHRNLPSLSFAGNESKPTILDSCNGLLLCEIGCQKPIYIVCNLTTQKYKVLPKPTGFVSRLYLRWGACLAFDPSKSPHYKVVLSSRYRLICMYNSESGNWKKILPPNTCYGRGVFWNGAIYWLSYKKVLLRFEVDAEKMTMLPLPPSPRILSPNSIKYFGECGGGLILIQIRSFKDRSFAILELESDASCWIVKYWVHRRTIGSAFPEMKTFLECYVLCIVKGEKKEDYKLVLAIPGKVISYNLKCNTMEVLCDLVPGAINYKKSFYAYPFAETLSPV